MLHDDKNFSTIEMIPQNMIIHKGSRNSVVCAREGGANTAPLFLISFAAYFAKRNANLGGGGKRWRAKIGKLDSGAEGENRTRDAGLFRPALYH